MCAVKHPQQDLKTIQSETWTNIVEFYRIPEYGIVRLALGNDRYTYVTVSEKGPLRLTMGLCHIFYERIQHFETTKN